MIWMPEASMLLYCSKYMPACLLFRQSVAGLEDITCTCSYAHVQNKNRDVMKSAIKHKGYLFARSTGRMWSLLSLFSL